MNWTYEITTQYLPHYDAIQNANNVKTYLESLNFSVGAIIGIIANMEHESCINPGQQEHGYGGSTSYGYGLVQWTPGTKIIDYASDNNEDWYDGDCQMDFLMINAPQSWIKKHNVSWNEYKELDDIYYATRVFFDNFERGTWADIMVEEVDGQPGYAPYWYETLYGDTPPTPPIPPTPDPDYKWYKFILMSGKYRKRKNKHHGGVDKIK